MSHPVVPKVVAHVAAVLTEFNVRHCRVCVGLSGGLDSVVLLSALCDLAKSHELLLSAVHVNHGLNSRASEWARHCAESCERLGVPYSVESVVVDLKSGLGLEAAARRARYAVYADLKTDFVALAHHCDDQVETLLIQLLRGSGAAGLSAMPIERAMNAGGLHLLRPLLALTRSDLETFAKERALRWEEDDSNSDLSLDRNYLRHTLLPMLGQRFPAYRSTLSRVTQNLADSAALLDVLARHDVESIQVGQGLRLSPLKEWPQSRALNVLRYLFRSNGHPAPHRAALEEALRQAITAQAGAQMRVDFGDLSLRRYRELLFLVRNQEPGSDWTTSWSEQKEIALPAGLGVLRFHPCDGRGVAAGSLRLSEVTVGFRRGGERMALAPNRPHRELRKLYQDADVAPWIRERAPLVFCGSKLVWVPHVGIAAEFQAAQDESAYQIEWVCDEH